jgi:hypothetical protein
MRSLLCATFVTLLVLASVATTAAADKPQAVDYVDYHGQLTDVPREALGKQSARVMVNGGELATYTTEDGSFTLHNLPVGSHLVDISLAGFRFPALRVDVSGKKGRVQTMVNDGSKKSLGVFYFESEEEAAVEETTTTGKKKATKKSPRSDDDEVEEENDEAESIAIQRQQRKKKGGKRMAGGAHDGDTVRIPCLGRHFYFEEHVPFNPMSYLKNPMVLMLGLTGFMAWMSSKMPKNEMKAAMRDINQGVSSMSDTSGKQQAQVGGGGGAAPRAVKPNAGGQRR